MFDINTAINTAIATAVAEAIAPLVERINVLEFDAGTLRTRITALENIVAEYSPTLAKPAEQALIDPLVISKSVDHHLDVSDAFWDRVNVHITKRVTDVVDSTIEAAIEQHCEIYDHDQYDDVVNEWGGEDPNDFVKDSDIEEKINDAVNNILRNATFSISL